MAAHLIPFRFDAHPVRTLLINDQPWFVASDVAKALQYQTAKDMARNLDDDERGRQIVPTPSGDQEMTIINESGLYSAILRSRKAEAKRFKKWVTAEVLPAIRKYGRYEDTSNQMKTLVGQTIGTDGFHCLGAVLDGKVRHLPAPMRKRVKHHIWSQVHKAFSVVSAQDIPAEQLDSVRNFIAAYAIEGEWLGKEEAADETFALTHDQARTLTLLLHSAAWVNFRWHQGIGKGVAAINRPLYASTFEHVDNMARAGRTLDKQLSDIRKHFSYLGGLRPEECAQNGLSAQ